MRDNGKIVAVISYITFIGWIIAYLIHNNGRTSLGIYHLRQALLIHIISMCISAGNVLFGFIPFMGWIVNVVFILAGFVLFIFWLLGLISAINCEEKSIPIIGEQAQTMFGGIN